ncbi:hypothetical protein HWV62_42008 [Athelia sp. TMB]|nr:hypothetical protein HWV62_42008 [Athelia sp. TMB]
MAEPQVVDPAGSHNRAACQGLFLGFLSSSTPFLPYPLLSAMSALLPRRHHHQNASLPHRLESAPSSLPEHAAIKHEVSLLRLLVEGAKGSPKDEGEEFANEEDDDAQNMCTVIPHELERVEKEDEEQAEQQEADEVDEERRRRRSELGRPRTPEPTHLGMPHSEDEEEQHERSQPRPVSPTKPAMMIEDLTERLTALSNQLETALELSSSLQAQHTAAQSTISALESKVTALETLVKNTQQAPLPVVEAPPPPQPESESLTQMLAEWKKTIEGQWSSVREEWATERERLASAREEWESKVKSVESNLGNTAAKFDAGLATLALLQRQQGTTAGFGLIGGDGPKGFQHSGGLVTPPSPRSHSADSDRPRHRRKRTNSSMRGRSHSHDVEPVAVEEHDEPTRPYTPSLPDDSSDCEPIRQGSIDSEQGKDDVAALKQLETPESSVRQAPITSKAAWIAGVDTESIPESESPSSYANGHATLDGNGHVVKHDVDSDLYMSSTRAIVGVLIQGVATATDPWWVKPQPGTRLMQRSVQLYNTFMTGNRFEMALILHAYASHLTSPSLSQ